MKTWKWVAPALIAAGGACGDMAAPSASEGSNPATFTDEAEARSRTCAGPEGIVCAAGKYCATSKESARCPDAETTGSCRAFPEVCTDIYQPACGCDGQTYSNSCQAAVAGAAVAYEGACAPFCGGFAGIPCPGAGTCVDNASDACDPAEGDVDCASLCRCEVIALCYEGYHWDGSPEVCACVADD